MNNAVLKKIILEELQKVLKEVENPTQKPLYSDALVRQVQQLFSQYFSSTVGTASLFRETGADKEALVPNGKLGDANNPKSTQYLINKLRSMKSPKSGIPYLEPRIKGTVNQNLQNIINILQKALKKVPQNKTLDTQQTAVPKAEV